MAGARNYGQFIVLSTGCGRSPSVFGDKLDVLGTFADISIVGLPDAEARGAAEAVEQDLRQLDHVGYTFVSEGELHELNEAIARADLRQSVPNSGTLY